MPEEKALSSLVETRSYQHCRERREIWKFILEAICDDEWIDEVAEDGSAYARGMLQPVKNGFDPAKTMFGRLNTASEAKFDKWLKKVLQGKQFPARQKRPCGAKPGLRGKIAEFIAHEYPDGALPHGVSYKQIATRAKDKLGLDTRPSERTVSRALGRK